MARGINPALLFLGSCSLDTRHSSSSRPTSRRNTVAYKTISGGFAAGKLKARGPGLRGQMPSCPRARLVGAQCLTGLDTSSLLRFVMLLKESLCCNITSLYSKVVLNNGFCIFLKVYLSYLLLE